MIEITRSQNLELYQSTSLFPVREFEEGIHYQKMTIGGNSVFSGLYVEEIEPGVTIDARYFHFGAGTFEKELVAKARHTVITSDMLLNPDGSPQQVVRLNPDDTPYLINKTVTDEILVTRIHNKPYLVITVTGGKAKIGVYVTISSDVPIDFDAALKLDGEPANLEVDKFIPTGGLDESTGTFNVVRIKNGALYVVSSPSVDIEGTRKLLGGEYTTSPGNDVVVHTENVPAGKKWDLVKLDVISRSTGRWVLQQDGVTIAAGRTGPATEHSEFSYVYAQRIPPLSNLSLYFEAPADRPENDLDFFAQIVESDI